PRSLEPDKAWPGWIMLTGEGGDNGWCVASGEGAPSGQLRWIDHDDPEATPANDVPAEDVFADMIEHLLVRGLNDAVEALLRTGKLPPPPRPAPAAARALPTWSAKNLSDRFRLLATLEHEQSTVATVIHSTLIVANGSKLVVFDIDSTESRELIDLKRQSWCIAAGERAVFVGGEYGAQRVDLESGRSEKLGGGNVTALAVDPAGNRALVGTRKGQVQLVQHDGSDARELTGHEKSVVAAAAFATDHWITLGEDHRMLIHDREGGLRHEIKLTAPSNSSRLAVNRPQLLVRGDEAVIRNGHLGVKRWNISSGQILGDEIVALDARPGVSCAAYGGGGTLLVGRAGARVEAWTEGGAWAWSFLTRDGSAPVCIHSLASRLIVFATSGGWIGEVDPEPCRRDADRRVELLALADDLGDLEAAAAKANLDAEQLNTELKQLQFEVGLQLFEPAAKKSKRERRNPGRTFTTTEHGMALLCERL
ncbi:MAG TPA: hypothetical protein PKA88_21125, partial [Polyangiaceae bacterium]|nr:hypothetical protein [Polyangiaceae bacterium]